eukprot:jgi/Mesen1/9621/ME000667S09275
MSIFPSNGFHEERQEAYQMVHQAVSNCNSIPCHSPEQRLHLQMATCQVVEDARCAAGMSLNEVNDMLADAHKGFWAAHDARLLKQQGGVLTVRPPSPQGPHAFPISGSITPAGSRPGSGNLKMPPSPNPATPPVSDNGQADFWENCGWLAPRALWEDEAADDVFCLPYPGYAVERLKKNVNINKRAVFTRWGSLNGCVTLWATLWASLRPGM